MSDGVGPCKCGHKIADHAFVMSFSANPNLHCTGCDLCSCGNFVEDKETK